MIQSFPAWALYGSVQWAPGAHIFGYIRNELFLGRRGILWGRTRGRPSESRLHGRDAGEPKLQKIVSTHNFYLFSFANMYTLFATLYNICNVVCVLCKLFVDEMNY